MEFKTKDPTKNPLMGWESSSDTLTEIKLEFSSYVLAIDDYFSDFSTMTCIKNSYYPSSANSLPTSYIILNGMVKDIKREFVFMIYFSMIILVIVSVVIIIDWILRMLH